MKKSRFCIAVLIFVFCIFSFLTGCGKEARKEKTASERMEAGKNYASQNRIEDAIKEFKEALALEPNNAETQYELGLLYYKTKDFKKAEESFKSSLMVKGKDPKVYNMLGLALEKEGLFEEAENSFQTALRINRRFEEAKLNLLNIDEAKSEYSFYKFTLDFIYVLSNEYSNGNNSFLRGVNESKVIIEEPLKDESYREGLTEKKSGKIEKYEVSSEIYLSKEFFDKCYKELEKTRSGIADKRILEVVDKFSAAIQQRQEAINIQVDGYTMPGLYTGEFERAKAKVKIADSYFVDAAKKLEANMLERPALFSEKDFANIKTLINYYSQEKTGPAESLK